MLYCRTEMLFEGSRTARVLHIGIVPKGRPRFRRGTNSLYIFRVGTDPQEAEILST